MAKLEFKLSLVVGLLFFNSTSALAEGYVSRACSFLEIPYLLRDSAALIFESIGPLPIGFLSSKVTSLSDVEVAKYWVLESLSTDYAAARYHLSAESKIYRLKKGSTYGNRVMEEYAYYRTPWTGHMLDQNVTAYEKFKALFTLDRNKPGFILYSARAGHSEIIERMGSTNFSPGQLPSIFPKIGWTTVTPNNELKSYTDHFWVIGNHYLRDLNGLESHYGRSEAESCNMSNLGFGLGDR